MASGIVLEVVSMCVCLPARPQPTLPSTRPPHPGGFAPGWGGDVARTNSSAALAGQAGPRLGVGLWQLQLRGDDSVSPLELLEFTIFQMCSTFL